MYGKGKKSIHITVLDVFVILLCAMTIFYEIKTYQYRQIQLEQVNAEQTKTQNREQTEDFPADAQTDAGIGGDQMTTTDGSVRIPERIRVLLTGDDGSYYHSSVIIESQQEVCLTGALEMTLAPGEVFTITDQLSVGDMVNIQGTEEGISVMSLNRACGVPCYEGNLTIERRKEGLILVNDVDLETYLKYVVPSEMPSSWPLEALKTQAVCARTYAVYQIDFQALEAYGADVDDTVSYQVYHNLSRQDTTDRAVEETAARILTYEGNAIPAYFFSTSWGRTSTDEVWSLGTSSDYLRSIALSQETVETLANGNRNQLDVETEPAVSVSWTEEEIRSRLQTVHAEDYESEDPWYRWQITFTGDVLQQKFQEIAPDMGRLVDLVVEKRSDGGAVTMLRLQGDGGSYVLEEEYAVREFFSPGQEPVQLNNGGENTSMEILPSAYIIWDTEQEEGRITSLTIYGGGYGHGVGMSQSGAKHMAEAGMTYDAMLQVFYRNCQLG